MSAENAAYFKMKWPAPRCYLYV